MAHVALPWADSPASWSALDALLAPSGLVAVGAAPDLPPLSPAPSGIRIVAGGGADGHLARAAVGPVDLGEVDELRLWVRADRATGRGPSSFFAELRVGSAALPVDDPGNAWHRLIPVRQAGAWELVRVSLLDLPAAARNAADTVQVRLLAAGTPVTFDVVGFVASTPAMVADVDAALLALLHQTLTLDVPPVTAIEALVHVRGATEPNRPWIRLVNVDVAFADDRTHVSQVIAEHDNTGPIFRRASTGYDVVYTIHAMATDRAHQARILEHVLRTLGPRGDLVIAGVRMPYERLSALDPRWGLRELRTSPFSLMASSPELAYRVRTHLDAPGSGAATHVIEDVQIVTAALL